MRSEQLDEKWTKVIQKCLLNISYFSWMWINIWVHIFPKVSYLNVFIVVHKYSITTSSMYTARLTYMYNKNIFILTDWNYNDGSWASVFGSNGLRAFFLISSMKIVWREFHNAWNFRFIFSSKRVMLILNSTYIQTIVYKTYRLKALHLYVSLS